MWVCLFGPDCVQEWKPSCKNENTRKKKERKKKSIWMKSAFCFAVCVWMMLRLLLLFSDKLQTKTFSFFVVFFLFVFLFSFLFSLLLPSPLNKLTYYSFYGTIIIIIFASSHSILLSNIEVWVYISQGFHYFSLWCLILFNFFVLNFSNFLIILHAFFCNISVNFVWNLKNIWIQWAENHL